MNDLISVIVPVYNVEKYINKCIDSIVNQTYKNLEIILVDDGSLDKCGRICDEYANMDNRIKVIHKENAGVSSARNSGIENSTGSWIAFVDADDWIERNYFTELLRIAKEKDAELILCGYNRITNKKSEKIDNTGELVVLDSKENLNKILNPQTGYALSWAKLYKRDIIGENLFDTTIIVGEDALFNERVSVNINNSCFYKKSLYNYRIHSNSVVKKFNHSYVNNYLKAIEINRSYLKEKYNDDKEVIQNYYNFVAFHVLLIAVNYCYNPCNANKRQSLKEVCNEETFKEGIEKSNYKNLSLTRKIALFTIKHKLYFLTGIISRVRQIQNSNRKEKT